MGAREDKHLKKLSGKIRKVARERRFCSAVVVAAGKSERMGEDKLMSPLRGIPVLVWTLRALEASGDINEIVVAARPECIPEIARYCRDYGILKASKVVAGGKTRVQSALAGAAEVSEKANLILIHDGARPFVTAEVIERAVQAASLHLAAVAAIPAVETIKLADNDRVSETPPREKAFMAQTPQVFEADLIKAALTEAVEKGLSYTDDSGAVEAFGVKPRLTEGAAENIKLTTPQDFALAEAIAARRSL